MAYRSIFMAPDWVHVRHLGWRDSWPDPGLRIMTRHDGPIVRHLVLTELEGSNIGKLRDFVRSQRNPFTEITLHDLTGKLAVDQLFSQMDFRQIDGERMLNTHTIAIDLANDEATLLAAMSVNARRNLRKAETAATRVEFDVHRDPIWFARFLSAHTSMAGERRLKAISETALRSQIDCGHSRLAVAFDDSGEAASFVLTYESGGIALYHYGASDGPHNPVLGRSVHWGLICRLKAEGFSWYDLGGLPVLDPSNGITRFKLGFGGEIVDLGKEYRWSGSGVRLARKAMQQVRRR